MIFLWVWMWFSYRLMVMVMLWKCGVMCGMNFIGICRWVDILCLWMWLVSEYGIRLLCSSVGLFLFDGVVFVLE